MNTRARIIITLPRRTERTRKYNRNRRSAASRAANAYGEYHHNYALTFGGVLPRTIADALS